jgi:hypothetical protein
MHKMAVFSVKLCAGITVAVLHAPRYLALFDLAGVVRSVSVRGPMDVHAALKRPAAHRAAI